MADPASELAIILRHPDVDDYARIQRGIDDWWSRRVHEQLPRLWFEHFAGTSWVALTPEGDLAGFLAGFVSPDHPDQAVIVLAGVSPNHRRRGVGRRLHDRFVDDSRTRGIRTVTESIWPGDRGAVAFLSAIGFRPDDGPGTERLYGTPSRADLEWTREDRATFVLRL